MSNNFYAHWTVSENVNITLHIGKTARTNDQGIYGFTCMNGEVFSTVSDWRNFLIHNRNNIRVSSEIDHDIDIDEFVSEYLDVDTHGITSEYSINHRKNNSTISDTPLHGYEAINSVWIDDATGQLFYGGFFC